MSETKTPIRLIPIPHKPKSPDLDTMNLKTAVELGLISWEEAKKFIKTIEVSYYHLIL